MSTKGGRRLLCGALLQSAVFCGMYTSAAVHTLDKRKEKILPNMMEILENSNVPRRKNTAGVVVVYGRSINEQGRRQAHVVHFRSIIRSQ